jgi:beta-mannosidase
VVSTYKALELTPSGLAFDAQPNPDGTVGITISCAGLGLYVMLEADCAGQFSDNAFDMLAGESRTITFAPAAAGAVPRFVQRDLFACQASE